MKWTYTHFLVALFLAVGLANAAYVAYETASGGQVGCYVVQGCDLVLTSSYASWFGIPLSYFGVVFYAVGIGALCVVRDRKKANLFFAYTCVGFAVSLYLVYLQAFVVGAFCSSCILSAVMSACVALGAFFLRRVPRTEAPIAAEHE